MRNFYRLDVLRTLIAAIAACILALMPHPAAAFTDYCVAKGLAATNKCIAEARSAKEPAKEEEEPPKKGSLREALTAALAKPARSTKFDHCEKAGHDVRDDCESKALRVIDQSNARCDTDYCWALVKTVARPSVCARVLRGALADRISDGKLTLLDYVLEGEKEALKPDECPDEMLDGSGKDAGLEMPAVEPTAGWACIIAGDDDRARWTDGYCYAIFKMGDGVVCGRARKDRVAPVRLSGTLPRRYLSTSKFYDCPRSVWQNYNRWKGDKDMSGTMDDPFSGKLRPVPTGTSSKPESDITGLKTVLEPDDALPPSGDTVHIDVEIGIDGRRGGTYYGGGDRVRPGMAPTHGEPNKRPPPTGPSTVTGIHPTPTPMPPPIAGPKPKPLPPVAGPPPAPRPLPAPGPIAGPPPAGGMPHGVKIDVAPTGRNADLSDIRGKVMNIAPKDD
jgi:hypothetical protein